MEIQEIKIDGVIYVPANKLQDKPMCTDCAFKDNCNIIIKNEFFEGCNPCELFGNNKILKIKKNKNIQLALQQLKIIHNVLILTRSGNIYSGRDTAFDRLVRKAISFIEPLIKEN